MTVDDLDNRLHKLENLFQEVKDSQDRIEANQQSILQRLAAVEQGKEQTPWYVRQDIPTQTYQQYFFHHDSTPVQQDMPTQTYQQYPTYEQQYSIHQESTPVQHGMPTQTYQQQYPTYEQQFSIHQQSSPLYRQQDTSTQQSIPYQAFQGPQTPYRGQTSNPTCDSQLPLPKPFDDKYDSNALPSSAIEDWPGKKTIQEVIEKNKTFKNENKAPTLAMRIARDAMFGEKLMKKCTSLGCRDLPGLPRRELYQLKTTIFHMFPQYWEVQKQFEPLWSNCIDSIGQACKHFR